MSESSANQERRKHFRIPHSFSFTFYTKENPENRSDITFLKDISLGGACFRSSKILPVNLELIVEVGIPIIAPRKAHMIVAVVGSKEIVPNLVYETSVKFLEMDEDIKQLLGIVEKRYFKA